MMLWNLSNRCCLSLLSLPLLGFQRLEEFEPHITCLASRYGQPLQIGRRGVWIPTEREHMFVLNTLGEATIYANRADYHCPIAPIFTASFLRLVVDLRALTSTERLATTAATRSATSLVSRSTSVSQKRNTIQPDSSSTRVSR